MITNRIINSTTKRFVELFTTEDIKYEWDPVRLDSSLTLDDAKTITNITLTATQAIVTAADHNFQEGDTVRLDNIVGLKQLNKKTFIVSAPAQNSFVISLV